MGFAAFGLQTVSQSGQSGQSRSQAPPRPREEEEEGQEGPQHAQGCYVGLHAVLSEGTTHGKFYRRSRQGCSHPAVLCPYHHII